MKDNYYLPLIKRLISRRLNLFLFSIAGSLLILALSLRAPYGYAANPSAAMPTITLIQAASGFSHPTDIKNAGDGSNRLFVVDQPGQILIVQNGAVAAAPFLDISGRVLNGGERGLLGLAFPPGYANKKYFYVYYTMLDGNNVLSRFHVTANANIADPNSEEQILVFPHPTYDNHNGGSLAFGPDGYLYIGTGDGGGGGDPFKNAQNLGSLLGKILRIDVEMGRQPALAAPNLTFHSYLPSVLNEPMPGPSQPYLIPPTNPFVNTQGARGEIYAYGLRNPWRFAFDPANGNLYIADVGQELYEEIDLIPAGTSGQNFGWPIMEGMHCYNSSTCNTAGLVEPIAEYAHGTNESTGCAVVGGYVYRGTAYPALQGIYLYGDYCSGRVWGLTDNGGVVNTQQLNQFNFMITTFGQDEQGNLYLASPSNGNLYKITSP